MCVAIVLDYNEARKRGLKCRQFNKYLFQRYKNQETQEQNSVNLNKSIKTKQ